MDQNIIELMSLCLKWNFPKDEGKIVYTKMKLESINAEWWIELGRLKRDKTNFLYVRYCLHQTSNQDLHDCKFGVAVTVKGHPLTATTWYEASSLSTSSPATEHYRIDELKKLLDVDVVFKVKRVEIDSRQAFWNQADASREMLVNFSRMRTDESFSDFKFIVQGKEFKVHRLSLAAVSPVFTRLFLSDLKESRENLCTIEHIEPKVFEDLLHFIYEANVPNDLNGRAIDLYKAAHYYEMELLMKICEGKIRSQLSIKNALDSYIFAHTYDLEELKKSAWEIVKRDVFKIDYRIKGEPLSPSDLHELIENRKSEQKFWENLKDEAPTPKQPSVKPMKYEF